MAESSPNAMPTVRLNSLTAVPLLRLMLALQGLEPPLQNAPAAWEAFKRFARLRSESTHDVCGFQAVWILEDEETPLLQCSGIREFSDEPAGFVEDTRSVSLELGYYIPYNELIEDAYIWSDEFPSLDEMFSEIEQLPQFRIMMTETPDTGDVYSTTLSLDESRRSGE